MKCKQHRQLNKIRKTRHEQNEFNKEIEIMRTKQKYALKAKTVLQKWRGDKEIPRQTKAKGVYYTSPALQEIPKSPSSSNERTLTSWKQNSLVKVNI